VEDHQKEQYKAALQFISLLPFYDKNKKEQYLEYKNRHKNITWVDVITYVNIGLGKEFYENVHRIADPDNLSVLVSKYNQLNEEYIPGDLEMIDTKYNTSSLQLRHEARIALEEMCRDAEKEGIHLEAVSTFRSFHYQMKTYLSYITSTIPIEEYQAERDKVSARPGFSEHQTGLAVDLNELEESFEDTLEGRWLAENSYQYGFILRYPKEKEYITGYVYEPWHFRYLGKDLAQAVFYSKLTYDEFYTRYIDQTVQELYNGDTSYIEEE
jgi:D-alanyl-D-alanine carboxypeptidase